MTTTKREISKIQEQKGATAVEFAVIAALLFFILFGILEFGIIFMQEHYVANAAREGVRIGIRANNYNCFGGKVDPEDPEAECTSLTDRKQVVADAVEDYLSTLYSSDNVYKPKYEADDITVTEVLDKEDNLIAKTLSVTVEVKNFFPAILSSLASLFGAGFELPETISHTASGEYEEKSEP